MSWKTAAVMSAAILIFSLAAAVLRGALRRRQTSITPFRIILSGLFISLFVCQIPLYRITYPGSALQTVLFSLHSTFQIFTVNADRAIIAQCAASCPEHRLSAVYSAYLSLSFVLAPILTLGFLISFFKNLLSHLRYLIHFFDDVCIFSALNEKSLALGADLKQRCRRTLIVFTDVNEIDGASCELAERARELRAVCFRGSVQSSPLARHGKSSHIAFFALGEDEGENVRHALWLIDKFHDRDDTELFVFCAEPESELLLSRTDTGKLRVRRVNDAASLVNRFLYEKGAELFENAQPTSCGARLISIVIVGMGRRGTEMLKALTWFCQMDGWKVEIDAFDSDLSAEERFAALSPELMSERFNGTALPGEAEYTIRIHSGCDVNTKSFADEIQKHGRASYVFVSLGDDGVNIRTAAYLRMLYERCGAHPVINAVVSDTARKKALSKIANFRGQPYDIDFIGDVESSYSENVIINSELEAQALKRHLKWGERDDFYRFEYYYRSSVAAALHRRARIACGIPGAEKRENELTDEERGVLERLEHRRWNAYMRAEGYVYSGSHEPQSRNDLGKMHNDLIDFSSLTEEEKRKDSSVGTR